MPMRDFDTSVAELRGGLEPVALLPSLSLFTATSMIKFEAGQSTQRRNKEFRYRKEPDPYSNSNLILEIQIF